MVNWYWKHKLGELNYRDVDKKQNFKLEMFGGNVMCAFIYRYRDTDENGKTIKMYRFFFFFNDLEHAKRVFKDDKDFLHNIVFGNVKCKKIKLKITSKDYKHSNKEMIEFAKLLIENGYKVEVY